MSPLVATSRHTPLLEKHPDKTFIGRVEQGFDFVGYNFRPEGLSVAKKTIEGFVARCIRLYEQEPGGGFGLRPVCVAPLGSTPP